MSLSGPLVPPKTAPQPCQRYTQSRACWPIGTSRTGRNPLLDCRCPMVLLVLFAVGLVARAAAGAFFLGPAYPDSFYYVNVAHALAAGRGFNLDYIWHTLAV